MNENEMEHREDEIAAERAMEKRDSMVELDKMLTVAALQSLSGSDPETAHSTADRLLLQHLRACGSGEVADAFNEAARRIGFWYS